jgi:hypothetical protein
MLLNDGNDTHFTTASGNTSSIDLTLSSTSIGCNSEWKVIPATYSSDHWPIIINIKYRNNVELYELPLKWNLKNPNWELYTQLTNYELDKLFIPENEDAEVTFATLENIILTSASKSIGITRYKGKKPSVTWWNKACDISIRNKKKSL